MQPIRNIDYGKYNKYYVEVEGQKKFCPEKDAMSEYYRLMRSPGLITDSNINRRLWHRGYGYPTLLLIAVFEDHKHYFQILIDLEADIHIPSEIAGPPLRVAIYNENVFIVEKLLENGADSNYVGLDGKSMFQVAIETGHPMIIEIVHDYIQIFGSMSI